MKVTTKDGTAVRFENRTDAISFIVSTFAGVEICGSFGFVGARLVCAIEPDGI